MGHYVRVASYSPQTAAKPAAFVRTPRGLSSEAVENNNLFVTMYGGLPTNHRPPQKQRLSSAHPADFRLRLLEAPAYTADI